MRAQAAALALLLCLAGCCHHDIARRAARLNVSINIGHANDEALPLQAREIGADNAEAWAAQLELLEGEDGRP